MAGSNGNNTGGLGGFGRGKPGPCGLLKEDPRIGRALRRFSGTQWMVDEATLKINNAGQCYVADVSGVPGGGGSLTWVKITKTFTDFAAAASSSTINIYTLPAGGVVHAWKAKHSAAFLTFGSYKLVGIGHTGSSTAYGPPPQGLEMITAPSDTFGVIMYSGLFQTFIESQSATTQITATVATNGPNTNGATQGSLDIWLLTSVAT